MYVNFTAVMVVEEGLVGRGGERGTQSVAALELVANRPILHHALDALDPDSLDAVILVGGADALLDARASLRDYAGPLGRVEYAVRRGEPGLAGTLRSVADLVGESPCLVQPADGLLEHPIDALLSLVADGSPDLLLFSPAGETAAAGIPVRRTPCVTGRGPDLGVFGRGAAQRLAATDDRDLQTETLCGWRRYRGGHADLLELNRVALDRVTRSVNADDARENQIEGRVEIDPTAVVKGCVLVGPVSIGPGAQLSESYVGPYTSIGAGARIDGAEIERSIVCAQAEISHVGGRISSSLVGRNARVGRDFSLPRVLRLWIGDGDEVALP